MSAAIVVDLFNLNAFIFLSNDILILFVELIQDRTDAESFLQRELVVEEARQFHFHLLEVSPVLGDAVLDELKDEIVEPVTHRQVVLAELVRNENLHSLL